MTYIDYLRSQFQYFSGFSGINNDYIFNGDSINPKDKIYHGNLQQNDYRKIHPHLYPCPVLGDLEKGKIYICSLNPGFGDGDYNDELTLRPELEKQLAQNGASMIFLDPQRSKTGGGRWWRNKFKQNDPNKSLVKAITKGYETSGVIVDVDENKVFEMLSRIVVTLELFPYHSKTINYQLLNGCQSVSEIRKFVHEELIPKARQKDQIVCFTRAIRHWRITPQEEQMKDVVFCSPPNLCRCITFNRELPLGSFILEHIRKITNNFTILL